MLGAAGYSALAYLSLTLPVQVGAISPIWLANAFAVAFLLRARLSNEVPFLLAVPAARLAVNLVIAQPEHVVAAFAIANLIEIIAVLALSRAGPRRCPDMTRPSDLVRFVWAGGLVGPALSALCVAPVLGGSLDAARSGVLAWLMADGMALLLIVPTVLLVTDHARGELPRSEAGLAESLALLAGGMTSAFLIFNQSQYPLMFLIPPITLLHAFRLGSLGSAVHVVGVALVAGTMTSAGLGPIAAVRGMSGVSDLAQLYLLQAFVAANFLTGLPIAAIIAGRDRMTAALAAGKREVDLLADNITDAILRYDLHGVCTYASPSVREVMGAPPETYVGKPLGARLHPDSRDRAIGALARLLEGASEKERVTYRRFRDSADGTPVFLEADCAVVRNAETGQREGVVVAARDVTERIELELLLTRARRTAENAARAKSEFLANMSHEIRTPMNGVLGFAELMLQGDLDDQQRHFAELIVQSGRSMMTLLNDVLDLSKIESGQFAIATAPVDLHASLAECAALLRPAAERKGLTLELLREDDGEAEAPAPSAPWITTDGLRLRQIVLNLLGNAVKFTEAGQVRLAYRITPNEVRITIADTGIGISAERIESIFQPFTQGESDTDRRFGGTGLGLSISRQLAALLGGRIEAASAPGRGSHFTLVLPAVLAAPVPVAVPAVPESPPPLPTGSRILLVEDHDINRLLVREMLERCGLEVEAAHDGNEAIAMVIDSMLRARPYDLVLMDVHMPGCDGYAATRAIRTEGIGPDVLPIIALTANAFPEDVAAARVAGMQGHLAKPVVFADLARALQRWLPTRIVESDTPPRAPGAMRGATSSARSPQMLARWQARRRETLAAVEAALAEGGVLAVVTGGTPTAAHPTRDELIRLTHQFAGTAGLFGEDELGRCAAALERSLQDKASPAVSRALAQELVALAEGAGQAGTPQPADSANG